MQSYTCTQIKRVTDSLGLGINPNCLREVCETTRPLKIPPVDNKNAIFLTGDKRRH